MLDFVIGTNAVSDVTIGTIYSVWRLFTGQHRFFWDIRSVGGTARTRNVMATQFLQRNLAPYLLFVDRDIIFTPEDMNLLLNDLKDYDLIAGCYAVRGASQLTSFGLGKGTINLNGEKQEVKWLATGFSGMTRKLLQDMVDKLHLPLMNKGQDVESYPFFEDYRYNDPDMGSMFLTEDYAFCLKARKIGVKSYLDTRIQVRHIGERAWDVSDVVAFQAKEKLVAHGNP